MAQASNVIYPNNWDAKHSESFRDLEGDICDLALMAKLADREIEDVLDGLAAADPDREGYERGMFAIGHLRALIDGLKRRYYSEFEAARS